MLKFVHGVEKALLIVLLLAMAGVTFVQVIARYVFNAGAVWALELTVFLFAWLVLLGAAHLAREGRHIGIDALISVIGRGPRKLCGLAASAACVGYAVLMLSGSWTYFSKLYRLKISAAELPVPSWVVVSVLPLSFLILVVRFGATFLQILTDRLDSMMSSLEDKELVAELNAAQAGQRDETAAPGKDR
ncbi:TRAP transporter small permease [Salipiger sp. P9]|uniref:TRAP transporter small permease n=1 Tax=Salipiger pentaromativorans TaxID=2943193 RepID=UPI0021584CFD|nr:TRAP transporter small permease [Salipiger pentaromativorans]MCR8551013.1 TRAP transporter small permease [Salipiger pentaromativorans]